MVNAHTTPSSLVLFCFRSKRLNRHTDGETALLCTRMRARANLHKGTRAKSHHLIQVCVAVACNVLNRVVRQHTHTRTYAVSVSVYDSESACTSMLYIAKTRKKSQNKTKTEVKWNGYVDGALHTHTRSQWITLLCVSNSFFGMGEMRICVRILFRWLLLLFFSFCFVHVPAVPLRSRQLSSSLFSWSDERILFVFPKLCHQGMNNEHSLPYISLSLANGNKIIKNKNNFFSFFDYCFCSFAAVVVVVVVVCVRTIDNNKCNRNLFEKLQQMVEMQKQNRTMSNNNINNK